MSEYDIYLIRHGQTFLNTVHRFQGWIDSDLTELGKQQASLTGQSLHDINFDLVISSDSQRAINTRDIIINQLQDTPQKISKDPAFREVFFSTFEGLPASLVMQHICSRYGFTSQDDIIAKKGFAYVRQLMNQDDPVHKAELYPDIIARFRKGLYNITQQIPNGGNILIVSHGAYIRTVADYLGVNVINNFPSNAGVTKLRMKIPSDVRLIEYNHTF